MDEMECLYRVWFSVVKKEIARKSPGYANGDGRSEAIATRVEHLPAEPQGKSSDTQRMRRLVFALTVLAWITIAGIVCWLLSLIIYPIMLMVISVIIAYVLYPLVKLLRKIMPNALAILIAYLGVLVGLLLIFYYIVLTAVAQLFNLFQNIQHNLPTIIARLQPIVAKLEQVGLSKQQFAVSSKQLLNQVLAVTSKLLPLTSTLFSLVITCIIITSLSVYFMLDGRRVTTWLHTRLPLKYRARTAFFVDTLNGIMGAFLRGQLLAATITTCIVAIGLAIIGVPYVILLAVVVFIFEFVPQIGSYISAAIIIAFAFITKGWQIGIIVAIFSTIVQGGLDGQILIPRILGGAVGLHPIISMFALLVGAVLFGLPGAIFAAPIAGIMQIFLLSAWRTWQQAHPDQFPEKFASQEAGAQVSAVEAQGQPRR